MAAKKPPGIMAVYINMVHAAGLIVFAHYAPAASDIARVITAVYKTAAGEITHGLRPPEFF